MRIRYGRHSINETDIKSIENVLRNDYLTQGKHVKKFENALKIKIGSRYCSSRSSGTAALHLGVMALSLPKNSKIITTPLTFVATANSIIINNLKPELVDIDLTTYTIDVNNQKIVVAYSMFNDIFDGHKAEFTIKNGSNISMDDILVVVGDTYGFCGRSGSGGRDVKAFSAASFISPSSAISLFLPMPYMIPRLIVFACLRSIPAMSAIIW